MSLSIQFTEDGQVTALDLSPEVEAALATARRRYAQHPAAPALADNVDVLVYLLNTILLPRVFATAGREMPVSPEVSALRAQLQLAEQTHAPLRRRKVNP